MAVVDRDVKNVVFSLYGFSFSRGVETRPKHSLVDGGGSRSGITDADLIPL